MALKRGNYHVVCDFCGGKSAPADSGPAARKSATKAGWGKTRIAKGWSGGVNLDDLCPSCAKRRKGDG